MKNRIALISAAFFFAGSPVFASPVKVGEKAPEVEIVQADGATFKLSALHGKTVLIHFWATWCPACRVEMPLLAKFYKEHSKSVAFLAISADRDSERKSATKMMDDLQLPWAMLKDAKSNGLGKPGSLPVTYVIDPEGVVKAVTATVTEDELESYFASAKSSSTVH